MQNTIIQQTIEGTARTAGSAPASKKTASASQLGSASKVSNRSFCLSLTVHIEAVDPMIFPLKGWHINQATKHAV